MKQFIKRIKTFWVSDVSFLTLLGMLVFTVFVLPVLIDRESGSILFLNLMLILLFFVGIFSSYEKSFLILSVTLLALHIGLRLIRFSHGPYQFYLAERVVAVLNLMVFIVINFRLLFRDSLVNFHRVIGAINVYLSLALLGAFSFEIINIITGTSVGGNITLTGTDEDFGQYIYFSLSSISTLGMGDIHPVNTSAKMLSVFLSTIGVLYPAVVIAKLVTAVDKH